MYNVVSSSLTDVGKVREINEDSILEKGNVFAVADGMGGHQAGEVASSLAASIIEQYVEDNLGAVPGEKLVANAIASANSMVYQRASSSAKLRDMGTTVTMLYREGNVAYIGHVGDSRAYLFRAGKLRQVTRDHSLVAKLVEEGQLTQQEARTHPQRNIILRALGLEPRVEADISSVEIQQGDMFLLVTDGMTSMLEDGQIEQVLSEGQDPENTVKRLVEMSLEAGGTDNVSAVLVSFQESSTIVPVAGARPGDNGVTPLVPGMESDAAGWKRSRALKIWLIVIAVLVVVLAAGFGVGYYFYNRTFFVAAKNGKVTLYKGFPFWGISEVEKRTDLEVKFLPEPLRRRVESRLEPESRAEANRTVDSLEREIEKNSTIVPNVEGLKFETARDRVEKAGLRAEVELVSRPSLTRDVVIVQDPPPGSRVGKGSSVKMKVVMGGAPAREV